MQCSSKAIYEECCCTKGQIKFPMKLCSPVGDRQDNGEKSCLSQSSGGFINQLASCVSHFESSIVAYFIVLVIQ